METKTPSYFQEGFPFLSSFKRHFRQFAFAAIIGGAVGIGVSFAIPRQWNASLLFQIGQVGNSPTPITEPANVVQRIQFPSFISEVLRKLNLPNDIEMDERSQLIHRTLQARLQRSGNLIEINVRGFSPDDARKSVEAALQIIQNEHAKLLLPSEARLKDNLAIVNSALNRLREERAALLTAFDNAKTSESIDEKFSENILLVNMIRASETEARALRDQKLILEEQLSPYRTFNTKAVALTHVPNRPTFPKRIIFLIGGIVTGLILAFIVALTKDKKLLTVVFGNFRNNGN